MTEASGKGSSRRDFLRGFWLWGDEAPSSPSAEERERRRRSILPQGPPPPCLRLEAPAANPCVGCDAPCVDVCEPGIIRIHPDDHSLKGRAYLDFERAGCTWCGDCLEVCPQTPPEGERVSVVGQALLDEGSCLPYRWVPCTACRTVCPTEALLFDQRGRPAVKSALCDGCGMCVAPCPTDALRVVPVRSPH